MQGDECCGSEQTCCSAMPGARLTPERERARDRRALKDAASHMGLRGVRSGNASKYITGDTADNHRAVHGKWDTLALSLPLILHGAAALNMNKCYLDVAACICLTVCVLFMKKHYIDVSECVLNVNKC